MGGFPTTPSNPGDITAVTAGTGLTGGGSSGAVTVNLDTPVSIAHGGTGNADGSAASVVGAPSATVEGDGVAATSTHRTLTLPTTTALLSTASPSLIGTHFIVTDRYGGTMQINFTNDGAMGSVNVNTTTGNALAAAVVGNWLNLFGAGSGPDISATNPSGSTLLFAANLPGTLGVVTLTTTASNITLGTLTAGTAATGSVTAGGAAGTKAGVVLGQAGQPTLLPGIAQSAVTAVTTDQFASPALVSIPLEIGQVADFEGWVTGTAIASGGTLSVTRWHVTGSIWRTKDGVAVVTGSDSILDIWDHSGSTQWGTPWPALDTGIFNGDADHTVFVIANNGTNSADIQVTGVAAKHVYWTWSPFRVTVTPVPVVVN